MSEALAAAGVHVRAPGKLNLFFEVGGVQQDGYHDVASAYQAVSLFEDVWATPSDEFTVAVSGTVDVSGVPADDRNLAVRAARLLAQMPADRGRVVAGTVEAAVDNGLDAAAGGLERGGGHQGRGRDSDRRVGRDDRGRR